MTGKSAGSSLFRGYCFLCGTRDYHAMDWYRSAKEIETNGRLGAPLLIATESRGGEGFPDLARSEDDIQELFLIDRLLSEKQTRLGSLWRNILKFALLPVQIALLRNLARANPGMLYFAHSMYYMWLAWGAGVDYVATPQGSDLLVKPYKSAIYRFLARRALRSAKLVTVDSTAMATAACEIAGVSAKIVQNGIDIEAIKSACSLPSEPRELLLSTRGITPLYQTDKIVESANHCLGSIEAIDFVYPFHDADYREACFASATFEVRDHGRVTRDELYDFFRRARLVVSIPSSDSSPRSVYEAIMCGAPVAIAPNPYLNDLPESMQERAIVVDFGDPAWLGRALLSAQKLLERRPDFKTADWNAFDQKKSLETVISLAERAARPVSAR